MKFLLYSSERCVVVDEKAPRWVQRVIRTTVTPLGDRPVSVCMDEVPDAAANIEGMFVCFCVFVSVCVCMWVYVQQNERHT